MARQRGCDLVGVRDITEAKPTPSIATGTHPKPRPERQVSRSRSAMARPIPFEPPVTIAVRPDMSYETGILAAPDL
jgi:hypothetical protein